MKLPRMKQINQLFSSLFDLWVNGGGTPQCSAKRREREEEELVDLMNEKKKVNGMNQFDESKERNQWNEMKLIEFLRQEN